MYLLTHIMNKNIKQLHVIIVNTTGDHPYAPPGGALPVTRAPQITLWKTFPNSYVSPAQDWVSPESDEELPKELKRSESEELQLAA